MDQQELRDLNILIIETSAAVRDQLSYAFGEAAGCNVVVGVATRGDEGIETARTPEPNMIVFDFFIPYAESMEVLRTLRIENARAIIVVSTMDKSPELRVMCRDAGANFFIGKSEIRTLLDPCELARKTT